MSERRNEHPAATTELPLAVAQAHGEIIAAARDFVAMTSVFRQRLDCRREFERLAIALLALSAEESKASRV